MSLPTKWERLRLIRGAELTLAALNNLPVLTPCTQCAEYLDGFCRHWQQAVPDDFRNKGCDEFCEPVPF